jgi:multiple sugar transport system substrate-binding protein
MKLKTVVLYGTVFLFVFGLMAVGVARAEKAPLTLWVGSWICQDIPGEDQAYRLEKEFEAEYPDVDVKVVSVPWVGMLDKFMLAARTGDLPDVMCTESFLGWTQLFASYGHMMDLTDLMEEVGKDMFFPGVLEGQIFEGRYYSIPYRNSTRALVYNKDMFKAAGLDPDKPPQTWAQLREYALKLTKDTNGDGITDQWGFGFPAARFTTVAPEYLRAVMRSYGADILNEDMNKSTIDTPEAIEAIRTRWSRRPSSTSQTTTIGRPLEIRQVPWPWLDPGPSRPTTSLTPMSTMVLRPFRPIRRVSPDSSA